VQKLKGEAMKVISANNFSNSQNKPAFGRLRPKAYYVQEFEQQVALLALPNKERDFAQGTINELNLAAKGKTTKFGQTKLLIQQWVGTETGLATEGGWVKGHEPVPAQKDKLLLLKKCVDKILPKESNVRVTLDAGISQIKANETKSFLKTWGDNFWRLALGRDSHMRHDV